MRHKKGNKKLNKPTDQRIAMIRSISMAFFLNDHISTTRSRAKEVQRYVERIISVMKNPTFNNIRTVLKMLPNKQILPTIINKSKQYNEVSGGYTRIYHLPNRLGDNAKLSRLEFV
jgi:large subunit ribosomal protein L17